MAAAFAPGLSAAARLWVVAEALGPPRARAPHPLGAALSACRPAAPAGAPAAPPPAPAGAPRG